MSKLTVDFSKTKGFIDTTEYDKISYQAKAAIDLLHEKNGPGNAFLLT